MTSGQIVGKMDTQKQLNVPLDCWALVHCCSLCAVSCAQPARSSAVAHVSGWQFTVSSQGQEHAALVHSAGVPQAFSAVAEAAARALFASVSAVLMLATAVVARGDTMLLAAVTEAHSSALMPVQSTPCVTCGIEDGFRVYFQAAVCAPGFRESLRTGELRQQGG
jgi:hypothetical protein